MLLFESSRKPEVVLPNSPKWTPVTNDEVTSGQLNWFSIELAPKLLINPFKTRMDFWEKIYKKQVQRSTKTEL